MSMINPLPAATSSGRREDKRIYIALWRPGRGWVPAGAIVFNEYKGYSGFSYFQDYVDSGAPALNPATLNYKVTGRRHFPVDPKKNPEGLDRTFWELLPTSGDFASQVIISQFPEYRQLNKLHQLYRLGARTVGGLSSYTDQQHEEFSIDSLDWLDAVRDEAVRFHLCEIMRLKDTKAVWSMVSYGGVRPKATFKDDDGRYWIAKFNLPSDPYDMAKAEALALRLAKDSGLAVPETKVITLESAESIFLIERFDRKGDERFHGLSLYALAPGIDRPSDPSRARLEGAAAMASMMRAFSDFKNMDTLYLLKKLMMDLAVNNTDNHLRNVRMLLDENDKWVLSPMFDMFFNVRSQPHIVSPSGLPLDSSFLGNPDVVARMSDHFQVPISDALTSLASVQKAMSKWEMRADELGITDADKLKIRRAITIGMDGPESASLLEISHSHSKVALRPEIKAAESFRPNPPRPNPPRPKPPRMP